MEFYFDESKHPRGGFIVGAFVAAHEDLAPHLGAVLRAEGLVPGIDEFKSSSRMVSRPEQRRLRERLREVLTERCRVAVLVHPYEQLSSLGEAALEAFVSLLRSNGLPMESGHRVFLDEQVFARRSDADRVVRAMGLDNGRVQIHVEQDSRVVLGLQLADLAAHTCAMMLLQELGLLSKMVPAGEESGFEAELAVPLGFEMWAAMRYTFFSGPTRECELGTTSAPAVPVKGYGLFVSRTCSAALRAAAHARFGEMYLGCIH